jgi:hypothetical protein
MKKYDKYKDSGIEWIGEIPEHWDINKLNRIFAINTGFTPPTGNNDFYEYSQDISEGTAPFLKYDPHEYKNKSLKRRFNRIYDF